MKFTYIIWSPQGEKPPTVTFTRRWAAENEAKRLSLAHPNQVFHVCKIKSTTVAGQSAYFGKWRPSKNRFAVSCRSSQTVSATGEPWKEWRPSENVRVVVSESDLIDEQPHDDLTYRLGMAAMVNV